MACPICKCDNPIANKFCGNCGAPLDQESERIAHQVDRLLQEKLKDRALVEFEVTEKVIGRLEVWAKLAKWGFGGIAGIFTVLGLLFAFFGIKSYGDAKRSIDDASQSAVEEMKRQTTAHTQGLSQTASKHKELLNSQYQSISVALDKSSNVPQLQARVRKLETTLAEQETNAEKLTRLNRVATANPETPIGLLDKTWITPSPTSVTSSVLFTPLQPGSTGERVKQLQIRLKELGCYEGDANGTFDMATAQAVTYFKRTKRNVTLSFIDPSEVDFMTWSDIFSNLRLGDRSCAEVRVMEKVLLGK